MLKYFQTFLRPNRVEILRAEKQHYSGYINCMAGASAPNASNVATKSVDK